MTDLVALKATNEKRWAIAKLTRNFAGIAKALIASKPRYQAVEAKTGVPWFVIAVIHERESSQNWGRSLAQGDPWNRVSTHVPAGRGPFISREEAAIDALANCHPYLAKAQGLERRGRSWWRWRPTTAWATRTAANRLPISGPGPINTDLENSSLTGCTTQAMSIISRAARA
jgi:lysozyme family protein